MTTTTTFDIPDFAAGEWTSDPVHSGVGVSAVEELNRRDFGITFDISLADGGAPGQ